MSKLKSDEHETLNVVFDVETLEELRRMAHAFSKARGERVGAGTIVREIVEGYMFDNFKTERDYECE
jgi:hypothetical protein